MKGGEGGEEGPRNEMGMRGTSVGMQGICVEM